MTFIHLWSWSRLYRCEVRSHFSQAHWGSLLPEQNQCLENSKETPVWIWLLDSSYCHVPN